MRFFQPGLGGPVAALGLIAAATTAKGIARSLGATGGTSAAQAPPAAPVNDPGVVQNTTYNLISNVSGLVDTATFQRELANQFNEAQERGLLRMAG